MKVFRLASQPLRISLALSLLIGLSPMARSDDLQSFFASNTAFGLNLYTQLATNQGNLFFSPFSISTCLAMTYAGASGDTSLQMAQVLGFETNQAQFSTSFAQLQRDLEATQEKGIELNIANALWTQRGFPFLPGFLEIATIQYQANINQADFATEADTATTDINIWVAQITHNRIQNALPPGLITPRTRLVLANAIYFKGVWTESFAVTNTSTQPFYPSSTNHINVPLMHQPVDLVNYTETAQFQAIELPYGSNQVSMLILLPRQVDGLSQLEQHLSPDFISTVLARMQKQDVEIFLPRFTLESSFQLNDLLSIMGMPDAFQPGTADFSGIDGATDLYISALIHKAWGQVNEEGTEAAAVTIGVIGAFAVGPVFRADHPFLYFIRDTQSGSLLFFGRVAEPSQVLTPIIPSRKNASPTNLRNS